MLPGAFFSRAMVTLETLRWANRIKLVHVTWSFVLWRDESMTGRFALFTHLHDSIVLNKSQFTLRRNISGCKCKTNLHKVCIVRLESTNKLSLCWKLKQVNLLGST